MGNKCCLKNLTTERNIVVNCSINLPKSFVNENIRIKKKYYPKIDPKKSLIMIRELRASKCSPIKE